MRTSPLDGHRAPEVRVTALTDDAHPAAAELRAGGQGMRGGDHTLIGPAQHPPLHTENIGDFVETL